MTSNRKRFVAKATEGLGWRIWNTQGKHWWGEYYKRYPEELLAELNGEKRGAILDKGVAKLRREGRKPQQPRRVR